MRRNPFDMKILVCISNVPDTTAKVKFTNNTELIKDNIQWIINPWDELALTRAIELKETHPDLIESITVINVGSKETEPTIRKALAIGADDAIRINTEPKDSFYVAHQLAKFALDFDMILCGIESSDYQGGATGEMLAEICNLPSISGVSHVDIVDNQPLVTREVKRGNEILSVSLPFVAIIQKGIAHAPKIAAIRGIMMARKKSLKIIEPMDTNCLIEYIDFELPPSKAACKLFKEDEVNQLVETLHNKAKVL
ncbi:MAG: hypothetical protein ACEPOV_13340 [Hyphomicrobiales bacterium]